MISSKKESNKMKRLGISVYPDIQSLEEIEAYISLAASYDFSLVFSSMWSIEGSKDHICSFFQELIEICHRNRMKISLDVNPQCFQTLGANYDDLSVFAELGVDILRMDMSYGAHQDAALIHNPYGIEIVFNASSVTDSYVEELKAEKVDLHRLTMGHNFYPQRYTGLKWQKFLATNAHLKKDGFQVSAFVSSQAKNTVGVWDAVCGLPTVEFMRDYPIDLQARLMIASGDVDEIVIGNACASKEELELLRESVTDKEVDLNQPFVQLMLGFGADIQKFQSQKKLKVHLDKDITDTEKDILFNFFPHMDNGDSSEWIWRSRFPRFLKKEIPWRRDEGEIFPIGSLLMVNDNYRHYAGEVQIALLPIRNDGTRNHIGYLDEDEIKVCILLKDGDVVLFVE